MHTQFEPQLLISLAADAIIVAADDGSIIFWNEAAVRIFGYSEAEALGRSLDLIIPERLRNRHWVGYNQVMQSGETRYGAELLRVPALHKDGRPLSIAFTVALLPGADSATTVIAAIVRDETARRQEDQALRRRLAELETQSQRQLSTPACRKKDDRSCDAEVAVHRVKAS